MKSELAFIAPIIIFLLATAQAANAANIATTFPHNGTWIFPEHIIDIKADVIKLNKYAHSDITPSIIGRTLFTNHEGYRTRHLNGAFEPIFTSLTGGKAACTTTGTPTTVPTEPKAHPAFVPVGTNHTLHAASY